MKAAYIIIDVQNLLVKENPYNRDIMLSNINYAISLMRENDIPVIFVRHCSEELVKGSDSWQISDKLDVREEDLKVDKTYSSMFKDSPWMVF